jgi:hypothetical protein
MPRNNSGVCSLPAGNPVVPDTTISSGWANPTLQDIVAMLSDSLSRTGKGGMQVAFQNTDGTANAPGITFALEQGSGFFRAGAGDLQVSALSVPQVRWTSTGVSLRDLSAGTWVPITAPTGVLVALTGADSVITGDWSFTGTPTFNDIAVAGIADMTSAWVDTELLLNSGATATFKNAANTQQSTVTQVGADFTTNLAATATYQVGGVNVLQVSITGLNLLNGKSARFYNAANSVSQTIAVGSADELVVGGRGGLWGWLSNTLPRGRVSVSLNPPAATGSPGDIVLVYE